MIAASSQQANRDHPEKNELAAAKIHLIALHIATRDPTDATGPSRTRIKRRSKAVRDLRRRGFLTGNPEVGASASAGAYQSAISIPFATDPLSCLFC